MIKVNYLYKNNLINSVSIKGHANYDTLGKDIVCAAVSSIVTTTINDIVVLDKDAIDYNVLDGEVILTVLNENEVACKLLSVMLNTLKELATDYPKNIKIGGLK